MHLTEAPPVSSMPRRCFGGTMNDFNRSGDFENIECLSSVHESEDVVRPKDREEFSAPGQIRVCGDSFAPGSNSIVSAHT